MTEKNINIEKLIQEIYGLKVVKKQKKESLEQIKLDIERLDNKIETLSQELLKEFKNNKLPRYTLDDKNLIAEKFSRENIGYTSDSDVLNYLKTNYNSQYIKTKITESLDKNALKKAIKTDSVLAEALQSMTVKSVTEYIVVTDTENYKRMLEHINEGK